MKILLIKLIAIVLFYTSSYASAEMKISVQLVTGPKSPEFLMAQKFASDVKLVTSGEVIFEIVPKLETTEIKGLLEKVNKGEIGAGIAYTHYWSSYHSAAMLFGSPTAGAGLGFENISWVSWFLYGGGRRLYDEPRAEMGMNIKGLILQPLGPEALGRFNEPIKSMDDFRDYKYRAPPAYLDKHTWTWG